MASKLLIAESPLQLLPTLAKLVGVTEGLVLQQLHYESLRSRDDGWVTRSITEWQEDTFSFLGVRTVERAFSVLRRDGLIETSVVPVSGGRATRMRVDHKALDALLETAPTSRRSGGKGSRQAGGTGPAKLAGSGNPLKAKRSVANAPDRETREPVTDSRSTEIERLVELLAKRVGSNTTLPVDVDPTWHGACRAVLEGVERIDVASAELQLERVIEWATVDQFWRTRISSMGDLLRNRKTLWQQAQPWRDPDDVDDDRRRRGRRGRGGRGARRVGLVVECVTPAEAVAGRWAVVDAGLRRAVDSATYEMWLSGLHPHSLDDAGWTVGIANGGDRLSWVAERFGRVLEASAGKSVRLVACTGTKRRNEDDGQQAA